MKKVFAILAVVAFVACNSGENKEATADTTQLLTQLQLYLLIQLLLLVIHLLLLVIQQSLN